MRQMVQMVLNMSLLMSQHVFCWTQWGSDRLPSSSCARFRVLYEDCSKTLRKETFFKPPGAHHQTNFDGISPPKCPFHILWVEILRKGGGPKHVNQDLRVRWTSFQWKVDLVSLQQWYHQNDPWKVLCFGVFADDFDKNACLLYPPKV